MNDFGVSDLSRNFNLRSVNVELNRSLVRLSEEVVTGRSSDTTLRLNAQFSFLSHIETDLIRTEARVSALTEVAIMAEVQQDSLGRVVDMANDMFDTLALAQTNPGVINAEFLATEARGLLDVMVSVMNTDQAGRYAFSGTAVTTPPLVSTEDLLTELTIAVAGATDEADLLALADDFFDLPGGGFETNVYQGGADSLSPIDLGNGETVQLNLRADDPVFRDMLKAMALIAISDDPALALPEAARRPFALGQTDPVINARSSVIDLRASLGFSEERIDRSTTRLETERASLELARNDLVDVDPFEAATAIEAVRVQLETLYSVTARTQNLRLVNFL